MPNLLSPSVPSSLNPRAPCPCYGSRKGVLTQSPKPRRFPLRLHVTFPAHSLRSPIMAVMDVLPASRGSCGGSGVCQVFPFPLSVSAAWSPSHPGWPLSSGACGTSAPFPHLPLVCTMGGDNCHVLIGLQPALVCPT